MRIIDVPSGTAKYTFFKRFQGVTLEEQEEVDFVTYLTRVLKGYAPFNKDLEGGRTYNEMMDWLEAGPKEEVPGKPILECTDTHYKHLLDAVKKAGWQNDVARAFIKAGFPDAIEDAQPVRAVEPKLKAVGKE